MAKDKNLEKGQKRMVHIKIWQNVEIARLSPLARLLYIGLIVLADDDGRLKGNSTLIKSQVFPFDTEMTIECFKNLLKEVVKVKLIEIYRVKGEYFIEHPNWDRYQYIRRDLYKSSSLPENTLRKRNGDVTEKIPKKRKEKEREEKDENHLAYLSKIPEDHIKEFLDRFDVSRSKILSKAEDFMLYCKAKGKSYKDYKSALLNAMKKDFPIREIRHAQPKEKKTEDVRTPIPQYIKDAARKIVGQKTLKSDG